MFSALVNSASTGTNNNNNKPNKVPQVAIARKRFQLSKERLVLGSKKKSFCLMIRNN